MRDFEYHQRSLIDSCLRPLDPPEIKRQFIRRVQGLQCPIRSGPLAISRRLRVRVSCGPSSSPCGVSRLTDALNRQVIVDNRGSASCVVAAEKTANAPPDGYTLLFAVTQHTVMLNSKLPYHPVNDFTPISQLTSSGFMLLVNSSTPVKDLQEFVAWTKNFRGALRIEDWGSMSPPRTVQQFGRNVR